MKYQPIEKYLKDLSSKKNEVTLKFSDIEKIIEKKLPKSARTYVEWWANQAHGSQAKSWMNAGYLVERLDLRRELVTFAKSSIKSRLRRRTVRSPIKKASSESPIDQKELLENGFTHAANWRTDGTNLLLEGELPNEPGVYAFVLDGCVQYIGLASSSLAKRLNFYRRPGSSQPTNQRLNAKIKQHLLEGRQIKVLVAVPGESRWNQLPVVLAPGLELGLIRELAPPWNKTLKGST